VKLVVRRGDRVEKVSVEPADGGFRVTVGDASYVVDAARAGGAAGPAAAGGGLHSLRIDGGHYEVAVHPTGDNTYRVASRRGADEVEVHDPLAYLAQEAKAASGSRGKERVTAMMPGRVVALLAEEGAEVHAGQGILVLEAMKMENEIVADRDGVVRKIFVDEGQPVDRGEALFEIE
jgi:pyruvate carboxylase subunit B